MKTKTAFVSKDLYFYYFFLIAGVIFIYSNTKTESFLEINKLHNNFLDSIMPVITFLGDGLFAVIVGLSFLLYRVRYSIFLLLSFSLSGLLVQFLKKVVFSDYLRPVAYFNELGIDIYTIQGLDIPLRYSFPSGHSTTAFALFVGISFFAREWYWKMILLLPAILVGFSRVYLAMHFPVDVIAGSLLGVLVTFICFIWISGWKKQWLDVSLSSKIRK